MKKQKRRLIALALSAAMAVNLMVYPAAAEGSGRTGDGENTGSSLEGLNPGTYHEVDPATPGNGSYNLLSLEREVDPATPGNADPFGKYDEPVYMTIGRVDGGQPSSSNNVGKWYQDHLNVTYDFQSVSSDEEWLSKPLNELPDVMQISSRYVLDQLVEKGYVADLTEVYDTYASDDVRAIYDSYAEAGAGLRPATFSDRLMALPGAMYGTQNLSLVWVRQDWLNQLKREGKEVAVDTDGDKVITPAELKAVAKAFVENKLGGEDTVGIANYDSIGDQNRAIFSAFHAYPEKWLMAEDGTIYNGSTAPEMKEALAYLHELNEEGLLDLEFATRNWDGLDALAKNHKLGIFINTWESGSYELTSLSEYVDEYKGEYAGKPKPKLSCFLLGDVNGQINVPIANTLTGFIAVRSDYAHPEAAMKLVNLIVDVDRGARESDSDFYRSKSSPDVLASYDGYRACIENGSAGNLEPFALDWYANDDLEKKIYEPVREYTDEVEREENLDPVGPDKLWDGRPKPTPNVYYKLWEHATNEDGRDREQYAERFLMPSRNTEAIDAYHSYVTHYDNSKYGNFYKWYAGVDCLLKNSEAINWVNCIYTENGDININWNLWNNLTKEVYVNIINGDIPEGYSNADEYFDWFVQEWNNRGGADDSARICGFEGSGLHQWGVEEVIKEPSCAKEGLAGKICQKCGKTSEERTIEKLTHTYVDGVCTQCGARDVFGGYEDEISLTIGRVGGGESSTENNVGNWYKQHLNVTYRFQSVGSDEEWLNKPLAELPDVLQISSRKVLAQLVEKGYAADLADIYATYASDDVKAVYDSYQDVGAGLEPATFNDHLMALPGARYGTQNISLVWIRSDWLEAVGLSGRIDTNGNGVITRTELETVARAFVEQKPGGAGTIGIANYASGIDDNNRAIFSSFGAYPEKWLKDGNEVYNGSTSSETKEALEYLHRLYTEGLLDPEYGSREWEGIRDLADNDQLGIYINTWDAADGVFTKNQPLVCFALGDESENVYVPIRDTIDGGFIVVRNGYEHPEAVMKLVNLIADVDRGARNTDPEFYKLKDNGIGYRELLAAGTADALEPFSLSWYANDDLEQKMYGQVAEYMKETGGDVYNGIFWEGGDQPEGHNREEYADRFLMPSSAGTIISSYYNYIKEHVSSAHNDYYKWFAGADCLLKSADNRKWVDCIYTVVPEGMEHAEADTWNELTKDVFINIVTGKIPAGYDSADAYFDSYIEKWNASSAASCGDEICGKEGSGLHKWGAEGVIKEPTCTETGMTGQTCEVCGKVKPGQVMEMIPHTYVDGVCTVCGSPEPSIPPQEPFERYDETVELTIGRVGGGEASTENNVGKWYQDHLNVTYRFQSAGSDEEWLTKSLEELPDVLQISSREVLRQLVEKGYIEDLTEVYGAYASGDVKAVYDSYQDAGAGLKPATFDGRLMALPGTMYGTQQASLVWIRRDWLDIVGLSGKIDTDGNGVITRGELETVARAFVDQKPGGADTIGIANYASIDDANRGIFSSFGSYPGKWLRDGDGNVYSGSTAPETREALAYLQRLYEEGLLDPEFGNRDWFDLNGIDGLTTLAKKNQLGILINTWTSGPEVLNGELSCYILGDDEGRVSIPISNTLDGFIVVRKGYEHPEAVMKLVNQIADVDRGARNTDEDFYKLKDNGSGYRELLAAGSAHSLEPFSLSWYANDDLEKAMYGQVADYVEATGGNVYNGNFWEGGDQEEGKNREEYADRFLMPPSAGDIIWNYNQYIREGIEGENGDGRYRLGYYKWFAGTDCLLKSLNAGSRSWTDCIYVAPTSSMEGTEQSLSNLTRDTFVKIIRGELPVDYFDTYVNSWNRRGGTEYLEKICSSEEGSGLHEWKADSVIEEATCTETGVRRYVCERCGAVKTDTISRLPHQYVSGKCAVCGSFSSQIPSEILDNVTWIKLGDGSWKLVKEDGSYAERIWANVNGVWYYFHENGIMATGWLYLDDVWYHLNNETGAMETGWYLDTDGKWYYLDSSGAMKTGWVKLGEIWYYLVPERIGNHPWGSMYANEYTPDGYWVNANGEWFDPFKSDGSAVTVTIGRSTGDGDWLLAEHGWTYENNPVIDWYEQQLNVDIRFAEGGTDYDSVIRQAMASGNLPDVMQVYSRELLNELVAKGLVEDLTDVYNNYASAAIKDVYGSYEGAGAGLKPGTFGGRIMALPGTMYGTQLTSLVWIRQDWLDQVGITLDEDGNGVISRSELEMTARAFLEKDPGGTGNPVGIANYVYTGDENRAIFSSFHSYPEKLLRAADGTVYNGSTAPETKEALSYLHRLYAEGLLDPQYGTRDWDGLVSLAANNQLGIFFNTWTSGPEVLKDGNLSCFVLGDDNGQVNVPISDTFHDGFVVVRKGYEHPEVVMRLVNLMADVEYGARNSDRGFYKTEYRNLKDAGTAYIVEPFTLAWHGNDDLDMKMYKPSRDYIDQTNGNIYGDLWEHPTNSEGRNREQYADRFAVPASTGGILWSYYDYVQQNNGNSRGEYYKWFAGVDSMLKSKSSGVWKWVDCLYPVMPEAMTNLYWDLYGYTEDVFVKIVKGELPIDYFDTYAAEWKKRGGAEYCRKAAEMSAR